MSLQHFSFPGEQFRNFFVGYRCIGDDFVDSFLFFLNLDFVVCNSFFDLDFVIFQRIRCSVWRYKWLLTIYNKFSSSPHNAKNKLRPSCDQLPVCIFVSHIYGWLIINSNHYITLEHTTFFSCTSLDHLENASQIFIQVFFIPVSVVWRRKKVLNSAATEMCVVAGSREEKLHRKNNPLCICLPFIFRQMVFNHRTNKRERKEAENDNSENSNLNLTYELSFGK